MCTARRDFLQNTLFFQVCIAQLRARILISCWVLRRSLTGFACTMYEVLTRKIPFDGCKNQHAFIRKICYEQERPDLDLVEDGCPRALQALMERCWDQSPDARPPFPEIVAALTSILADTQTKQAAGDDASAPTTLERIIQQQKHESAQADPGGIEAVAEKNAMKRRIVQWLAHDSHVLEGSMDDKTTHVGKLLTYVRNFVDDNVADGRKKPIALCFCGPSALAHTIERAATSVGGVLEYSADHQ